MENPFKFGSLVDAHHRQCHQNTAHQRRNTGSQQTPEGAYPWCCSREISVETAERNPVLISAFQVQRYFLPCRFLFSKSYIVYHRRCNIFPSVQGVPLLFLLFPRIPPYSITVSTKKPRRKPFERWFCTLSLVSKGFHSLQTLWIVSKAFPNPTKAANICVRKAQKQFTF